MSGDLYEKGMVLPLFGLPTYDIATLCSSFSVGYANAKGVDLGPMESLPVALPLGAMLLSSTAEVGLHCIVAHLARTSENPLTQLVCEEIREHGITPTTLVKHTAETGVRYGLESMVGYTVGRILGEVF